MSKYVKLEDAIHNINLEVTGRKEYTGDMKANLFFALDDLPTIEVSEDCISRAQAIEILCRSRCGERARGCPVHSCPIVEKYDNLPSVAPSVVPSRAEGEWIGTEYDGYADGNPVFYEWICSACKCVVEDEEPTWNYCPNCGCAMTNCNK